VTARSTAPFGTRSVGAGFTRRWPAIRCGAVLWALTFASSVLAQDEEDLFLFDIFAGDQQLAEGVLAYAHAEDYLVAFEALVTALEFPIARDGDKWSGWFRSEDRSFLWNMELGTVVLGAAEPRVETQFDWLETEDGTFASLRALERWFDLEISVDPRTQELDITSDEPLPFELWKTRTSAKYGYRFTEPLKTDVVVPDRYEWVTLPLVNFSTELATRSDAGVRRSTQNSSLAASLDLLKHSVVYSGGFANGGIESPDARTSTNRLTIERRSATPEAPLFWGIHSYVAGDIYQPSANLVMASRTGRGFRFDRYPDSRSGSRNQVTITADAPPGWEAELYRNGTLIGFATVGPDGRYFFEDEDVHFGENRFVTRLYGPQGQVREDEQVVWGGGIELDPGDYDFSVSHIDYSKYLLDGYAPHFEQLEATYATDIRYNRALSEDVSVGGAITRAGLATRTRDGVFSDESYTTAFARLKAGPGVFVGEAVRQAGAGHAWGLEYLTGFGGRTVNITRRQYEDFDSPATLREDAVEAYTEFAIRGYLGEWDQIGFRLGARHRDRVEGYSDYRLFGRIGTRLGPVSLSNDLEYTVQDAERWADGLLRLASRLGRFTVRGQIDYAFGRNALINQLSATVNWDVTRRITNYLSVARNLGGNDLTYLANQVSIRIRDFNVTFGMTTDFHDAWSLSAGLAMAFAYDERRGGFVTEFGGLSGTGRAAMNLFLDDNNNGLRDLGEEPVRWARYRDKESLAQAPGVLPLLSLPAERAVQIDTSQLEFDDPFLKPRNRAYELNTHAGSDLNIDVAVLLTGDIAGYVYREADTFREGLRGVLLTLRDEAGQLIAETRSEFDGYYGFTGVPGGNYEISATLGSEEIAVVRNVTLDARDGFVRADDIVVTAASEERDRDVIADTGRIASNVSLARRQIDADQ
jgi:hypothetical protein